MVVYRRANGVAGGVASGVVGGVSGGASVEAGGMASEVAGGGIKGGEGIRPREVESCDGVDLVGGWCSA